MTTEEPLFTHALGLSVSQTSLIAAVGNKAFLCNEKSSVKLPQVSSHKMIHGFAISPQCFPTKLLLLYTENEFSVFKYVTDNNDNFKLAYEAKTKDWINAAKFLNETNCSQFVLHMAHSTLLRIQYDETKTLSDCNTVEVACCNDNSLLYCTNLQGDGYEDLIVISGNGFGEILIWQTYNPTSLNVDTRFCPLRLRLKAHNGVIFSININLAAELLVTSSDDRSLKFWKLQSASITDWKWDKLTVRPMISCFGHTARVLCALIVRYDGHFFVISGGEDSNICIWSESGDLLFKRRHQFGAPIWRLDFDPGSSTIYSTGATGNILAYDMHTVFRQIQHHFTNMILIETRTTEFMKKVKYLNSATIIGLSNQNRLFSMKLTQKNSDWKLIPGLADNSSSILVIYNEIIAICGYRRVTLLNYNHNSERFKILYVGDMLYGHIQSFFFLSKTHFIVSDKLGNCLVLKGYNMDVVGRIQLNNCRNSGLTAALLVSSKYLLLSGRNGQIMLYKWDHSVDLSLKYTLKRLHGIMGSTILQLLKVDNEYAYVLSAGHSPAIKFLRVSFSDNRLTTLRRECLPLSWIEASPALDLFIGFNDNHLVVWSRQRDVILQLPCGGGHRCWDYQLENEELHIIYVKKNHIFYHREGIYNKSSQYLKNAFQNSWHSRNCNVIHFTEQQDPSRQYIVSAGDDNIIKIGKFMDRMFHQCAELHTHISSVRDLVLYFLKFEDGNNIWLIFSVGGRAQLCINQLNSNGSSIELFSNTVKTNGDQDTTFLHARLMAVNVLRHAQTGDFSIYVASADGNISVFQWQLENPLKLFLVHIIDIRRCPLHIRVLNTHQLVLITTTSGEVYGFNQTFDIKHFQFQLHSGGINAIDTLVIDNFLHLLTGGDNENIIHTIIMLANMTIIRKLEYSELHNAQVNSLALKQHQSAREGTKLIAYTCANDKQIYMVDLETQQYNRVDYTCISDVKGIILGKDQRLYIYGSGLQRLKI